jgi:piezo-type mechanosensitive ion channel component 1/2
MDNQLYWTYEVLESDRDSIFKSNNPINEATKDLVLVIYNEQVIGSLFGTALQLSVVGLYATIVIAIGRFLRLAFDRISQRVIYEEMDPETTEQLFEICEGIYIA